MGFLQICAGVILLQLSKSAKDVPDSAVFSGDLDQVRTVAEQEEPEYEPRADTIRGGASIIRSISRARTEKEAMEAKRLAEETMQPIGENEQVEWDGLRRRRTVLEPGRSPTIVRRKTLHPPLGMTHFPTDEPPSDDDDIHPGFFRRLRSRGKSSHGIDPSPSPLGLNNLPVPPPKDTPPGTSAHDHVYGLPSVLRNFSDQDTSYKHEPAIHWGQVPTPPTHDRSTKDSNTLKPPKPPPHTAKRQFSFQNVFHRNRSSSSGEASNLRPTSRHSRKGSKENTHLAVDGGTEEERLGLVKGDSSTYLAIPREGSPPSAAEYSDQEEYLRIKSRDTESSEESEKEKDVEKLDAYRERDRRKDRGGRPGGGGGGGAFL